VSPAELEQIRDIVETSCAEQEVSVVVPPEVCAEVAVILRATPRNNESPPASSSPRGGPALVNCSSLVVTPAAGTGVGSSAVPPGGARPEGNARGSRLTNATEPTTPLHGVKVTA
jgi:hypothetical protein